MSRRVVRRLGAILGQIFVGLVCDRYGRKVALVGTTLTIVIGAILGTAAHGAHGSPQGLFWFLTFARGITGIVRVLRLSFTNTTLSHRLFVRVWVESTPPRRPAPVRRPTRRWSRTVDLVSSFPDSYLSTQC